MTRRSLLSRALLAPVAAAVPAPASSPGWIDGPVCVVTADGHYLHFRGFPEAVCAVGAGQMVGARIVPRSEYFALLDRLLQNSVHWVEVRHEPLALGE